MALQFPADIEMNIRELVATGRFKDEADVVREALRLLDQREQRFHELRASIQDGIAQYERGEARELTDDLWEQLEREAEERSARGIEPKLGVCP